MIKIRAITKRDWNERYGVARFRVEKRLGKLSYEDWLKYTSRFLQAYGSACGPTSNVEFRDGGCESSEGESYIPGDLIFELKQTKLDETLEHAIRKNIASNYTKNGRLVATITPEHTDFDPSFAKVEFTTCDPRALRIYATDDSPKFFSKDIPMFFGQTGPGVRSSEIVHRLYEDFRTETLKEKLAFKISDA